MYFKCEFGMNILFGLAILIAQNVILCCMMGKELAVLCKSDCFAVLGSEGMCWDKKC